MSEETKVPQEEQDQKTEPQNQEAPQQEAQAQTSQEPEQEEHHSKKEKEKEKKKKVGETEVLKAQLEAAQAQAKAAQDRLLRTAAEYDNYRKRTTAEKDARFNDGISFALTQILEILDTLDMAANAPCADESYKKGVTMTLDKAAKALEKLQVEEIPALGQPFDPNLHAAVQQVPAAEGQESGQVVQVYQKGYKIGDKIIRHATVVVAE